MTTTNEHHLTTSERDLAELVRTKFAFAPFDMKFIAFGGTAYAYYFKDPNTKDFDLMIVCKGMRNAWSWYWSDVIRPFFQAKGYVIQDHTDFNRQRAITEFGQNHVRRYGIVTYKTVFGPPIRQTPQRGFQFKNMIDINFADSDLFEGDILQTNRWYKRIKETPSLYVISKNRLILDIVYDLQRGDQKRNRAQRALENLRKETMEPLEADVMKRIARALETKNVVVKGWGSGAIGWGYGAPRSMKVYQVLLTGISLATSWLEAMGIHVVLKGGTVSTQYTEKLQTNNIDVQLYRTVGVHFVPSKSTPGNVESNELNWAMYYGNGMFGSIVGFMVFMIQLLRTIDTTSIISIISKIVPDVRIKGIESGLRISHPPKPTRHITLLSIDMFIVTTSHGTATHALFDCVLGDIRDIPSEVHFTGTLLKMHDSNTVNKDFINMLETANPIKEEKRLRRFVEKKLGRNVKKTNLENHIIKNTKPVHIQLQSIPSRAWSEVKDSYVSRSNTKTKTIIGKMLSISEGGSSGSPRNTMMTNGGPSSSSSSNNGMNINIIQSQTRRLQGPPPFGCVVGRGGFCARR